MKLRSPFKSPGGKFYNREFVIGHFPVGYQHHLYAEPYCGSAIIAISKPPSVCEIINDLDIGVIAILSEIRDHPNEFIDQLKNIPYTEESFKKALNDEYPFAVNEFVLRRMSRGGMKKSFAWSNRMRGGTFGDVNAWNTIIDQLPHIYARLANVTILNNYALNIIDALDDKNTFLYLDPPYVHSTRHSKNIYSNEMTDEDHRILGERLLKFKGKVLLSGYPSALYDEIFVGWHTAEKVIANHASQQKIKNKKIERLWHNYPLEDYIVAKEHYDETH